MSSSTTTKPMVTTVEDLCDEENNNNSMTEAAKTPTTMATSNDDGENRDDLFITPWDPSSTKTTFPRYSRSYWNGFELPRHPSFGLVEDNDDVNDESESESVPKHSNIHRDRISYYREEQNNSMVGFIEPADYREGPISESESVPKHSNVHRDRISYYREEHNNSMVEFIEPADFREGPIMKFMEKYRIDHVIAVIVANILTYSLVNHTNGDFIDINLAEAVVVTLGSNIWPQLSASFAAGAFAGMVKTNVIPNYSWLCILFVVTSIVWNLFVHFDVLLGFGGRIGTSCFISTNITTLVFLIPLNVVPWSVYGMSRSSDSDSDDSFMDSLWLGSIHLNESLVVVGASVLCSLIAGTMRIKSKFQHPPVTFCSMIALTLILIVLPINWKYAAKWNAGVVIGSFLSMADLKYLPTIYDFGIAGIFVGLIFLLYEPFFPFGGKEGFIAFCGFSLYVTIKKVAVYVWSCSQRITKKD